MFNPIGKWLYHIVRCGLGGFIIFAAVRKIVLFDQAHQLANLISKYDLPNELSWLAAMGRITVELLVGLGLLFNYRLLYPIVRWSLGGLFVYAAVSKLLDFHGFAHTISDYGIVLESLIAPVAAGFIITEFVGGIGLAFDVKGSLAVITGLLLTFLAALSYGLWIGLDIDCKCFGSSSGDMLTAVKRDVIMLAGCVYLYGWRALYRQRPAESETENTDHDQV